MTTGKLWLSDLTQSNDPRETSLARDKLFNAISRFDYKQIPPESRVNVPLLKMYLAQAVSNLTVYSACLTPNRDDINQWKEYAEQGKGVSFSVRSRALRDMLVRIQQVRYIEDSDTGLFDNIVEEQCEQFRYLDQTVSSDTIIDMISVLLSVIHSTKHITWKDEREVRLTFASQSNDSKDQPPLSEYPDGKEFAYQPPLQRIAGENRANYYEFPFGRYYGGTYDKSGAIEEVIVGPNCNSDVAEIELFLKDLGYENFRITESACKFNAR